MKASSTPTPQNTVRKPQKSLLWVLLLLVFAVGFLIYRVMGTLNQARTNPQLHVSDDLPITPPPNPQNEDTASLRERLLRISQMGTCLSSQESLSRKEWLEFAREAGLSGEPLSAFYALNVWSHVVPSPAFQETLAQVAMQLGLYNYALSIYTPMAQIPEKQFASQLGLSRAYTGLQQNDRAMEILHSLEKTLPATDFTAHMELAIAFEGHGQQAEAIELMRKAHAIAPENSTITRRLAFALYNRQQFPEAKSLLEPLLGKEKEEETARTHILLAKLYHNPLNPHKDLALAESHLLLALPVESQKRDALKSLGELLLEQNRIRPALSIYSQLLALDPNDGATRLQFANAYLRLGDTANGNAQRTIAQPLIEQERRVAELTTRRNQKPTEPQAHLDLGKCYQEQGKITQALSSYQVAYALSNGDAKSEQALKSLYASLNIPFPSYKEMRQIALETLSSAPSKRHIWRE